MFLGRFVHNVDSKGRVAIPAAFRAELAADDTGTPVIATMEECLALFPAKGWTTFVAHLEAFDPVDQRRSDLMLFHFGGSSPVEPDGQGRILIPPDLRERARLGREVSIVGLNDRIEIWDNERLIEKLEHTQANLREITRGLAEQRSS